VTASTQFIRRPPVGPMGRIVRIAVITATVALVMASVFNVVLGNRDIAVVFALAAPLGISSWGFARAGQHEAAVVLLSAVMVAAVSLSVYMSPLGIYDHAVIAYAGVILFNALLLSRPRFILMASGTLLAATLVFVLEFNGFTNSKLGRTTGWPALFDFLLITGVVGVLGRVVAEILYGSLGDAQQSSIKDAATGLNNRPRFLATMASRMRSADADSFGVLAIADVNAFRRVNHVIGYAAADRLLAEVGQRAAAVSPGALVGRVGDDEFALFALDLRNSDEAREIARQLEQALTFEHLGVSVRVSVGFAVFPRDANGAEALWLAADNSLTDMTHHPRSRPAKPE
jgi:diguanylate cyclase (GGDEF)-like protein